MTNRFRSVLHPGSESSSRVRRVIAMIRISFSFGAGLSARDTPPIKRRLSQTPSALSVEQGVIPEQLRLRHYYRKATSQRGAADAASRHRLPLPLHVPPPSWLCHVSVAAALLGLAPGIPCRRYRLGPSEGRDRIHKNGM